MMTIATDEMLGDLNSLSPDEKIEFLLLHAEKLIPVLRDVVGTSSPFAEIYGSYERAISVGKRWLAGKISDPDEVIEPVENPSERPFESLELDHKDTEHFGNLRVVGGMIGDALLYAGQLQFERVGDPNVPQSLEEEFTDQRLVGEFQRTLSRASPELRKKFHQLWDARFRG